MGRGGAPEWADDLEVRRRIEAALPTEAREFLSRILEDSAVDPGSWLRVPALRQVFAVSAVQALAEEIRSTERRSREEAVAVAALRLGLPEETARTWLRRWRSQAA